jgi:hypothetical protein
MSERDDSAAVAYLDQRQGAHDGRWPEFQWACPFCVDLVGDESRKRKLRVNVAKQVANCFRCGFNGTLADVFRGLNPGGKLLAHEIEILERAPEARDIRLSLAQEVLLKFYGRDRRKVDELLPVPLPPEYLPLDPNDPLTLFGYNYLTLPPAQGGRQVDSAFIPLMQIGFCVTGRYQFRLVFPVVQGGQVVYFTTRYCGDHPVKSLNPKDERFRHTKGTCLLNYDVCFGEPVVGVVEGPLSAIGLHPAVCLLGKTVSPTQLGLLETLAANGTEEFVLGMDPDAGPEEYETYRELTGRLPKVSYLPLRDGDPDDMRKAGRMPELVESRREMTVADRVRGTFSRSAKAAQKGILFPRKVWIDKSRVTR